MLKIKPKPLIKPQIIPKILIKPKIRPHLVIKPKPKVKLNFKPIPEIQLPEYQRHHIQQMIQILSKYPIALDFSMLGSGKTYTSSYISLHSPFNFRHVIVVCPASLKSKWEYMRDYYHVPIKCVDTYNAFRAVKCRQPKHGLLTRLDYQVQQNNRNVDKVEFQPTSLLEDLIREGTLLILDEIQNVKNISSQFLACKAIIHAIVGSQWYDQAPPPEHRSRVILLSGSPIDQKKQVVHLFRLIKIMRHDQLASFNPYTYTNEWRGFADIVQLIRLLEKDRPDVYIPIPDRNWGRRNNFAQITYDAFQQLIKPVLTSSMAMVKYHDQIKIDKCNGFYDIHDPDDLELLQLSVQKLKGACNFNDLTEQINFGHNGISAISRISSALQSIEASKISTMVRVASERLTTNPNQKVVICANYSATIDDLKTDLSQYDPLVLDGKVRTKDRQDIIDKFQADSTRHRLLIGNLKVCSTGIDLDDKTGYHPRFCLVNPNYSTIDLYQLSHRFMRMDSKGSSTMHLLFHKEHCELRILTALAEKSKVMKETTSEQVKAGVVFLCDHQTYIEPLGSSLSPEIAKFLEERTQ